MFKTLSNEKFFVMLLIIGCFASYLKASELICEVYNFDTNLCEPYVDQNLTNNPTWIDFYKAPWWIE